MLRPNSVHHPISSTTSTPPSSSSRPSSASPFSLLFIPAIGFLAFASFTFSFDQNMSSPNLSDMAASFLLTPAERDARLGGLCMFVYFIVGGVFSLVVGGAKQNSASLVKYLSIIFAIANLFTAIFIPNSRPGFFSFLLCRVLAGAAFGGALPLIFSLAAKETSEESRTLVSGLVGTAVSAGAAVGQVLNGLLPGWRLGYLIAGFFGLAVAAGTDFFLGRKKPPSGPPSRAHSEDSRLWHRDSELRSNGDLGVDFGQYRGIFRVETNRVVFVQSVFGNIAWSVVAVFLADFIHSELKFPKSAATLAITLFGLGGLLGNIYGSKYGQYLFNKNKKKSLVLLLSLPAIVGTIPMVGLIWGKPQSFFALTLLLLGSSVAAIPGPNLKGLLLAANAQESRAAVFSAFQLVEMLGKGAGPIFVSLLGIISGSRSLAMAISVSGWAISGGLCLELHKFIDRETSEQHDIAFSVFFDMYDLGTPEEHKGGKIV